MALSVTNLGIDGLEDVEQIGTGGSSRVYRAREVDLDRVVAVKVLNPGGDQGVAKRFDRERKAMGRLSLNDGIVPVYSSGVTAHGEPFLVMPYYPNGSLQDQIDAGPMEWQTAVGYVDVAAETIADAHDEGIVHLDLKPANILLTNTGAPRIADFGIARLMTGSVTAGTTAGTAFTPAYSAPETFLDGETGPPSDVYGLGATLWALLVGHPPFLTPGDDSNLMAVIGRVVNNQVGDLRHIAPEPICAVVEQAMAKRPQDRFQSARQFSLALKQAAATTSTEFSPPADSTKSTTLFPAVAASGPATTRSPDAAETTSGAAMGLERPPFQTAGEAMAPAAAQRTLLQETAQPLPKPMGAQPNVAPAPFIDLDRFRLGPILLGVLAFALIVGAAAFALFRQPDTSGTTDGGDPASPSSVVETTAVADASTSTADNGSTTASSDTTASTSGSTQTTATTTANTTETSGGSSTTEATSSTSASSSSSTESTTTTELAPPTAAPRPDLLADLPILPVIEQPYVGYRTVSDVDRSFILEVPEDWVDELPTDGQVIVSPDNNAALANAVISGGVVSGSQGIGVWDPDLFLNNLLEQGADPENPCSEVTRKPYDDGVFDGLLYAEFCSGGQVLVVSALVSDPNRDTVFLVAGQMTDERDMVAFQRMLDSFVLLDVAALPVVE